MLMEIINFEFEVLLEGNNMVFLRTEIINFEVLWIGHNMANMLTETLRYVC